MENRWKAAEAALRANQAEGDADAAARADRDADAAEESAAQAEFSAQYAHDSAASADESAAKARDSALAAGKSATEAADLAIAAWNDVHGRDMPRERFTDFDFGLTRLAGAFHQDWGHAGEVEDVALGCVGSSEGAAALEHDASLLMGSALSDGQIELLWEAATSENYRFGPSESGRDLLGRFQAVGRDGQRTHGSARPETDPLWEVPQLRDRVLRAVGAAPLPVELREVLAVCARTVSAELAFRLLLRLHVAGSAPVAPAAWTEYQEINAAFTLGEYVIETVEYLVEDPR
ncbi:hypothetical protein [Streptomyces sp. NPDC060031]|uniref:hypothetical protein n=1 Tax=Streptomyces sp. NPDC060031 TaxID=3347043 RepID=UPI0036B84262